MGLESILNKRSVFVVGLSTACLPETTYTEETPVQYDTGTAAVPEEYFDVTVGDTNRAPVISDMPLPLAIVGDYYEFQVTVQDPDGDAYRCVWEPTQSSLKPSWLDVSDACLIYGTAPESGLVTIPVIATDSYGLSSDIVEFGLLAIDTSSSSAGRFRIEAAHDQTPIPYAELVINCENGDSFTEVANENGEVNLVFSSDTPGLCEVQSADGSDFYKYHWQHELILDKFSSVGAEKTEVHISTADGLYDVLLQRFPNINPAVDYDASYATCFPNAPMYTFADMVKVGNGLINTATGEDTGYTTLRRVHQEPMIDHSPTIGYLVSETGEDGETYPSDVLTRMKTAIAIAVPSFYGDLVEVTDPADAQLVFFPSDHSTQHWCSYNDDRVVESYASENYYYCSALLSLNIDGTAEGRARTVKEEIFGLVSLNSDFCDGGINDTGYEINAANQALWNTTFYTPQDILERNSL